MPRFTISRHDHPELHWDLFLEDGAELLTWRLSKPPNFPETISATTLPNHRLVYLDYAGPVSGDRGTVTPLMTGQFEWLSGDRNSKTIRVRLDSEGFHGDCELGQIDSDEWECRFQLIDVSSELLKTLQ